MGPIGQLGVRRVGMDESCDPGKPTLGDRGGGRGAQASAVDRARMFQSRGRVVLQAARPGVLHSCRSRGYGYDTAYNLEVRQQCPNARVVYDLLVRHKICSPPSEQAEHFGGGASATRQHRDFPTNSWRGKATGRPPFLEDFPPPGVPAKA